MKHDELRSIAHNLADSFRGSGFLTGGYSHSGVYALIGDAPEGAIWVDFLSGQTSFGKPTDVLNETAYAYRDALPGLCAKHGVPAAAFRELTVKYYEDKNAGSSFEVTVEDQNGQRSVTDYKGWQSKRPHVVDEQGRVRRKPVRYRKGD